MPLRDVNLVACLVRADPLDPDDSVLKIDRHEEAIIVALDEEDDPLGVDDARRRIVSLHICGTPPLRLAHFIEPGFQRGLDG